MRFSVDVSAKRLVYVTAATAALVLFGGAPVGAATEVQAQVCNNVTGSTIVATTPQTDSVVTTLPIAVSGTVTNTSQINISIDGTYDTTVPIGINQQDFTFDLSMSAGTHTVRLVANDRCHMQDGSTEFVLTYQPNTSPSNGGTPNTTVEQGGTDTTDGGVRIGLEQNGAGQPVSSDSGSIFTIISEPIRALAVGLDIDTTLRDGAVRGAMRFAMITSGAAMVSVGSAAIVSVLTFLKQTTQATRVTAYFARRRRIREGTLRVGGLLLFVLAFLV